MVRAQALPSNSVSYKQRVRSSLEFSLSLSFRYSCSNELNHISDVAEDHEHGLNSLLRNYLLSSFLLSFSKSLHVSSSPSDLSLSLNLPHHNIVCLPPTNRPFCPKYRIQKLFSSLSIHLYTLSSQQSLHPPHKTAFLIFFRTSSLLHSPNHLVFSFTLPNRHSP